MEAKRKSLPSVMDVWLWLTIIFLLYRGVLYLLFALGHITYPFDYDAGEGLILSRASFMAEGGNVYSPITQEPYFVMNYPPVFEGIVALIIKLFGPGLWIGRLLSVTAAVATAYCLYRIVRHLSGHVLSATVAGLFYFSSCWLTSWSVISRVDTFGVMCVAAGLAVITNPDAKKSMGKVVVASLCFCLALFTRQSLIAAPLACLVVAQVAWHRSLFRKNERMIFLASMLGFSLFVVGLLMFLTQGEFYRHTVVYTMGEYDFQEFLRWMGEFVNLHGVVIGLCFLYSLSIGRKNGYHVAIAFWWLSLLVSLTAGKEGSSINYFLEFWIANCVLVGLLLADLSKKQIDGWQRWAGPMVVGILFVQMLVIHYRTDFNQVRDTYRQSSEILTQYIKEAPGEVLAEYTGYLVMNDKRPVYQPFSMTQLAERGLWDESSLIADIKKQRFSLIIMTNVGKAYGRWSQRMQQAVDDHYDMIDAQPCYELSYYHSAVNLNFVYRPKTKVTP